MPAKKTLSFDRAADIYDQTRGWPEEPMRAALATLKREFADNQPVLDVGTGTGRFGIPMNEAGLDIVGADISREMLAKLPGKGARYPVVQADARWLPFPPDTFGGALAFWVLHLIEDWENAFDEVVRVLSQGGVFVVSVGGTKGFGRGPWEDVLRAFLKISGTGRNFGADSLDEIDAYAGSIGLEVRKLPDVRSIEPVTPEAIISMIENKIFSFTWRLPDDKMDKAIAELREWATNNFADVEELLENEFVTEWRAYVRA